jgi:hypothetical protein
MFGFRRLAAVGVVVAGGVSAFSLGARSRAPSERTEPPFESPQQPIVRDGPFADVREAERSRRARRPVGDPKREGGLNYEVVWNGWNNGVTGAHPKPAEPMPPTSCRSVEPAPPDPDGFGGPRHRAEAHGPLARPGR